MTQTDLWQQNYKTLLQFVKEQHRRPSKYNKEERQKFNWFKHNKKIYNQQQMPPERVEKFEKLLLLYENYRRINQHAYKTKPELELAF